MSKTFTLRSGILAMGLLAASGFAAAADEAPNSPPPGKHAQHRHDPVAHTQRNLDNLARQLNLKDEQKVAWQAYADSAIARARDRSAKMQAFHSHKGEARAESDTATKLDKMSQAMRERADKLQQAAQDTRALASALTPDQKTIFDLYWKAQFHQRIGRHPMA